MNTIGIISLSAVLFFCCNQQKTTENNRANKAECKTKKTCTSLHSDTTFNYTDSKTDKIPSGWSQYYIGKGTGTDWKIVDDNGNKVLAQLSANNPGHHFNEIVFDGCEIKNVELKAKVKGVSGKKDQGGGFIWRFIDKNNYYVVRANPLEDNVVLYKVEKGIRTDLPLVDKGKTYGVDVDPLGNDYNTLRLTVVDDLFTVYINDKQLFQVKDDTFKEAGKIGLWTKADAVTYFDDYEIKIIE